MKHGMEHVRSLQPFLSAALLGWSIPKAERWVVVVSTVRVASRHRRHQPKNQEVPADRPGLVPCTNMNILPIKCKYHLPPRLYEKCSFDNKSS